MGKLTSTPEFRTPHSSGVGSYQLPKASYQFSVLQERTTSLSMNSPTVTARQRLKYPEYMSSVGPKVDLFF